MTAKYTAFVQVLTHAPHSNALFRGSDDECQDHAKTPARLLRNTGGSQAVARLDSTDDATRLISPTHLIAD